MINALDTFINRVYGPAGGGMYVPPLPGADLTEDDGVTTLMEDDGVVVLTED